MKKISVKSNDQDWLFLMNKSLEQAGYEVHFIEEGESREQNSPDLLIIDTMSGDELSHYLKFDAHATQVPVFITSGDHTMKRKALNSGADHFLKKPFQTNNLISLIEKLDR
jgi:two-component system, sensor histidine kinase and response regulator